MIGADTGGAGDLFHAQRIGRNAGYVPQVVQEWLRTRRILIAGCGMGSFLAECLLRLGARRLRLVDGDVVEVHNLNRQDFCAADRGRPKVEALRDRLLAIDPGAEIEAQQRLVDPSSADELIAGCSLVVDTIDFLSLAGIVALHDRSRAAQVPVLSALNIGYGGGVAWFPADGSCTARHLFGLPANGPVDGYSYVEAFGALVRRIGAHLDPQVARVMGEALQIMEDGRPCPAPQVAAGSWSMGALAATVVVRWLSGAAVPAAPRLILLSLPAVVAAGGIDLEPPSAPGGG